MTFEGEEQINSDVSDETSSESQDSSATEVSQEAKSQEGQEQQNDTAKENVPFHKHPRWIERDNELKSERLARQDLEKKYADMEARLTQFAQPKAPPQPDKRAQMIERLKGIDPEFAEFVSDMAPAKELTELRQWREQMETERTRTEAVNTINSLHTQHKVSDEDKSIYNRLVEAEIRANPKARLTDLPNIYKGVHEMVSKRAEAIRRAERESYLQGKKAVNNTPTSQPKGKPANSSQAPEFSKDPAEARQQLISRVLKQAKASDSL